MDQVAGEQLSAVIDAGANSIAITARHLSGNMRSRRSNFLTADGEKPNRDRDSEFVARVATCEALMRSWEDGWAFLFRTLEPLRNEDPGRTITIRGENTRCYRQLAHYPYHIGQILLLAKLCLAGGSCDLNRSLQVSQQYDSSASSDYSDLTIAFRQRPVSWGDYKIAYTYATGQGFADVGYDAFADGRMRRLAFSGTAHASRETGAGMWKSLTRGLALSGYGDLTNRDDFPGMDFIRLNAQLTKSFRIGKRSRLELIGQAAHLVEHRNYPVTSDFGGPSAGLLSSYARFSSLGMPNSIQVGVRFTF